MPILDSSVFVCHCMFSLSFTSMSCDLEGRYPSLTNDSARVKNTYFDVWVWQVFSGTGAAQKSERTNLTKLCFSLFPSFCYYLGFVILHNDAGPCVTMVNSL